MLRPGMFPGERNHLRLVPCKPSKYMFFDECTLDPLILSG